MERLKNRHGVPALREVARAGEPCGARTDNRDLVPVRLRLFRRCLHIRVVPVGDKALQSADGDRLSLDTAHAFALALVLLRADAPADGRQRGGLRDDLIGGGKITRRYLLDKVRDADPHRAAGDAGARLAVQAALCLLYGSLGRVAERDLPEVVRTHLGRLCRHRMFFR